jgi:hypothetical protein
MGTNKTPKSIERLSRAAGGTVEIIYNFYIIKKKASSLHKLRRRHPLCTRTNLQRKIKILFYLILWN